MKRLIIVEYSSVLHPSIKEKRPTLRKIFHQSISTHEGFAQIADKLLLIYCATAALSIAASQIFILATIALYIAHRIVTYSPTPKTSFPSSRVEYLAKVAIWSWMSISFLACIGGVDPARAILELLKISLYLFLPFCLPYIMSEPGLSQREFLARIKNYLVALIFGQTLAAIHSIISAAVGDEISPRIPGPVTESGQLVLVIPVLVCLLLLSSVSSNSESKRLTFFSPAVLHSVALFSCALLLAWPQVILPVGSSIFADKAASNVLVQSLAFIAMMFLFATALRAVRRDSGGKLIELERGLATKFRSLLLPAGTLLGVALLINLKRGPWMGIFAELLVLSLVFSRRIFLPLACLVAILLTTLGPARSRMENLVGDFTISGGREQMWTLGAELVQRFPLGVGLNNAVFMRELDPTLPSMHRHMHNNILNIAVETGWLGLIAYLWWMGVFISAGFQFWNATKTTSQITRQWKLIALSLSLALLGWQVAGLVEYNFGDGEIRFIAFFYMGLLLALSRLREGSSSSTAEQSVLK